MDKNPCIRQVDQNPNANTKPFLLYHKLRLFVIDRLNHPLIVNLSSSSKLENHHDHQDHHHQSEVLLASLRAFRSHVSDSLNQLSPSNSKPGSKLTLSLSWIKRCLEALSEVNKAFSKLVMDIDHPVTKWEAPSMEEYLSYSLKLLNLLNSITRSLSHLGQSRLSISHALTLIQTSPASAMELLRENQFKNLNKDLKIKEEEDQEKEESDERIWSGKELIVHQALMILKSVGFWVCGIVLSGLSGDFKPYSEMKKPAIDGLLGSSSVLMDLVSGFVEAAMEREDDQLVLKEVIEVNEDAACLVAAEEKFRGSLENLSGKLEGMQGLVDGIGKEVDGLFKEILGGRNELLDCLRQRKQ